MKVRFKPLALLFCMGLLSFIVLADRREMVSIGNILAGGIVAFFGATAAGDYCRSRYYRSELDERNFEIRREGDDRTYYKDAGMAGPVGPAKV